MPVDPTADPAKLLPCPFCGGEGEPVLWSGNEPFPVLRVRCKQCRTEVDSHIDAKRLWNTRPQPAPPALRNPDLVHRAKLIAASTGYSWEEEYARLPEIVAAPPAGEPSREQIIEAIYDNIEIVDGPYGEPRTEPVGLDKAADAVLRLGLAARPKAEEAEVVSLVARLRAALGWSKSRDGLCKEAADLLERLADELADARRIEWERCDALAREIAALRNDLEEQDRADKAKLAEREAELAKADAVIDAKFMTVGGKPKPHSINATHLQEALVRHTARQQQKDAT